MELQFVIPAAGQAMRFNAIPKELLPISEKDCLLTHAVRLATKLGNCIPVVVSTHEKKTWHYNAIVSTGLEAKFVIKNLPLEGDMWGSVRIGMSADRPGGLLLPDTVVDCDSAACQADINFGCFTTETPERFSCLQSLPSGLSIVTKSASRSPMSAWGIVTWSKRAAQMLVEEGGHYDAAFEKIANVLGHSVFRLNSFSDLGTFAEYRSFLRGS